jgi:hypothetical protein
MKRIVILALLLVFAGGVVIAKDSDPKAKKVTATTTAKAKAKKKKSAKALQCEAMTAKGTQCTRTAQEGSKFCWQHDPAKVKSSAKKPAASKKS